MVTLCWSLAAADLRGEGEHAGGSPRLEWQYGLHIARRDRKRDAAAARGEGDGGVGWTAEIQGRGPRPAGLRRSVEADDQRALLGAGRLLEVERDGGFRQRRIDAGAEQRVTPVADA